MVMEVSSQGLMLNRTAGIPFEIGIFTNLGHDHIGPNEHKDFDDYKRCKGLLFKQCKVGIANVDDKYFRDVFQGATCRTETFGFSEEADLRAENVQLVSRPAIWAWRIMCPASWILMWRSISQARSAYIIP